MVKPGNVLACHILKLLAEHRLGWGQQCCRKGGGVVAFLFNSFATFAFCSLGGQQGFLRKQSRRVCD